MSGKGFGLRASGLGLEKRERAEWIAKHRAPVTPGLRGIHPTWIEAGLAGLPARAREVLAEGATSPVDVWLARWACAEFVPMPAIDPAITRPREPADLLVMSAAALEAWLGAIGRAHLAVAAAIAAGKPPSHDLGPSRAVIARCAGGEPVRIGLRAAAPHAPDHDVLRLRLPRGLAGEPGDADPPSWRVLTSLP